jgi:hypothetical protein
MMALTSQGCSSHGRKAPVLIVRLRKSLLCDRIALAGAGEGKRCRHQQPSQAKMRRHASL